MGERGERDEDEERKGIRERMPGSREGCVIFPISKRQMKAWGGDRGIGRCCVCPV